MIYMMYCYMRNRFLGRKAGMVRHTAVFFMIIERLTTEMLPREETLRL